MNKNMQLELKLEKKHVVVSLSGGMDSSILHHQNIKMKMNKNKIMVVT
jgi:PP-loop superfamily ATP-utilizing enzyme